MRAAIISVSTLCAGAAQACVIQPQSCVTPGGGEAQLHGNSGAVVYFREFTQGTERAVVVECTSREGLFVTAADPADYSDYWDAEVILEAAVFDAAPRTLAQVRRDVERETGLDAVRFTLPANHCGCELPSIPRPPSNCPADF